jgi:hypothetical protein
VDLSGAMRRALQKHHPFQFLFKIKHILYYSFPTLWVVGGRCPCKSFKRETLEKVMALLYPKFKLLSLDITH